jgi:hypothetical protein
MRAYDDDHASGMRHDDEAPDGMTSAALKIAHADRHLEEVTEAIGVFLQSVDVGFQDVLDESTGEWVWRTSKTAPAPPPALSVIVGDLLYDARSALDHVAWELVKRTGAEPDENTAFPIHTDEARYRSAVGRRTRGMTDEMVGAIERWQPWRVPNPPAAPLAWLQALSNIDKHRHLHLTVAAVIGTMFDPPLPEFVPTYSGSLEAPVELARFPQRLGRVGGSPLIGVAFTGSAPYVKYTVHGALLLVLKDVRRVVESFEGSHPASTPD